MVVVISYGIALCAELICLIMWFCPIVDMCYGYSIREGGERNLLYFFDIPSVFILFIATFIALDIIVFLVIKKIKRLRGKEKSRSVVPLILSFLLLAALAVQIASFYKAIFDLQEYKFELPQYNDNLFYSFKNNIPETIIVLMIIATSFSFVMCGVVTYDFIKKTDTESICGYDGSAGNDTEIKTLSEDEKIRLLVKYNELKNQGIISEEEFNEKKKELL